MFLLCLAERLVRFGTGICEIIFTEILRTLGKEDLEVSVMLVNLMRSSTHAVTHPSPALL